jgi:hypothetical protein
MNELDVKFQYYYVYLNKNNEFLVLNRYSEEVKKLDISYSFLGKKYAENEQEAILGVVNDLKSFEDKEILNRILINHPELLV